jgi:hypothetical protein
MPSNDVSLFFTKLKLNNRYPMPLIKIQQQSGQHVWGVWRIEEDEATLSQQVSAFDPIPEGITHPQKRLEFFAGRVLAKQLLESFKETYSGLRKNECKEICRN